MRSTIRWGRAVVAGLVAGTVGFVAGSALYANPLVAGLYQRFGDLPYAKPVTSLPAYLGQMMLGNLVLAVLWALAYAAMHDGMPGQVTWQKGLAFGLLLAATKVLPAAFNTWMQVAEPGVLVLVEAINSTLGALIVALLIAAVYGQPAATRVAQPAGTAG